MHPEQKGDLVDGVVAPVEHRNGDIGETLRFDDSLW